jgi:hypothetical protein
MTARLFNSERNAGQSEGRNRWAAILSILPWLIIAPLLTSCVGFVIPPGANTGAPPGPPSHDNAWLSYKVSRACGPIAQCQGLGSPSFTDAPANLSEASKYYCSIGVDPTSCAAGNTPQYAFTQWKSDNGFPGTGFPPAHAFYFNNLDLKLGRDMNCVQSGANISCYVSNYGPQPFDPATGLENPSWPNADAAVDAAINQTPPCNPPDAVHCLGLFATVAMTFNPTGFPNGDNVTFYVFNAAGNLVNNAALDGEGAKSVPRMCMACHGGAYTPNAASGVPYNSKAPGINFLPFDVFAFHYSQDIASNNVLNVDLQEGFRKLNLLVKITHTNQQATFSDTAILQSINDQYNESGQCGGTDALGKKQPPCGVDNAGAQVEVDPPPPSGWSSNPTLYSTVFRPYCRMCHLGQGSGIGRDITFSDVRSLSPAEVQFLACAKHDMPHAEVPIGGQSGSNLKTGLWWDTLALNDLNNFLNGFTGCH